jgi:hypothetical protein
VFRHALSIRMSDLAEKCEWVILQLVLVSLAPADAFTDSSRIVGNPEVGPPLTGCGKLAYR